jgi:hypothetical protein
VNTLGVPAPATSADVVAVAAFGLPGSRRTLAAEPLPPERWTALVGGVRSQRLAGLLADAIGCGDLPVTDAQADEVQGIATEAAHVVLLLEQLLLDSTRLLGELGIPTRVLKGPAVAHTVYPDPAHRGFSDVDLLVPGDRFGDAIDALLAAGGHRRFPEPRPGFYQRFGKGATVTMHDGLEVDLHRMFVPGPFGMQVDLDSLFSTATPFVLADTIMEGLGPEEQFLHACFHTVLGNATPRLTSVRDVAQILLHGSLDDQRVLHLAASWKVEVVLAGAIQVAWEALDLADRVPLSTWAQRYEPAQRQLRALRLYTGRTRNPVAQWAAALRLVPGTRAKAAYLHALLLPAETPETAGAVYERWRRGLRALARAGAR